MMDKKPAHRTTMSRKPSKPLPTADELIQFSTNFNVNNAQRQQTTWQKVLSDETNTVILEKVENLKTIKFESNASSLPNRQMYALDEDDQD